MPLILGLDTGGTFTDAAVIDSENGKPIAKAKAPTTRHDLSIGLGEAIAEVLKQIGSRQKSRLVRVSLSTTLATNAVVEGMGGRVGLVMIGFDETSLGKNHLGQSLGTDPVAFIAGGHKTDGKPQAPLDLGAIEQFADRHGKDISAIAIAGHFATRNPDHEISARDILRDKTGCPVTCSHELSSALGGPKRALTALLNARLIDLLDRQIEATRHILDHAEIDAELMVVKGDGSLISEDFARIRPVETILSGPAASISGAVHLTGIKDAVIADIGGTTTDISIMSNGVPRLSAKGASIGGWSTMVEAADIRTGGLGGDSEVKLIDRGVKGGVVLGPRRSIPIASLALAHPEVHDTLDEQLANPVPVATDGRFVVPVFSGDPPAWLTRSEYKMALRCVQHGVSALASLAETRLALGAIDRLVARGLLQIASFTPTDAAHILGIFGDFDGLAAEKAGRLMARQRTGAGKAQAASAEQFAGMVLQRLTLQSALSIVDSVNTHEGNETAIADRNPVLELILASSVRSGDAERNRAESGLLGAALKLNVPLIGLGASAGAYYPAIARSVGAELVIPAESDVAGAIGAAAGSIRQSSRVTVTQPVDGVFRVHLLEGLADFGDLESALLHAEQAAHRAAEAKARSAGALTLSTVTERRVNTVDLGGGKSLFIEAVVIATTSSIGDFLARGSAKRGPSTKSGTKRSAKKKELAAKAGNDS